MKYSWSLLVMAFLFLNACKTDHSQTSTIPYPDPQPDSLALTFLPGIVSADSFDFNANFSPDGQQVYFSRRTNGKSHLYVSRYDGKSWTLPEMLPFCETEFAEADPFLAADGTLYYISNRKRNSADTLPDYDIWCVHPKGDGKWSAPEYIEAVNTDSAEYYVSLSDNKNLYFASDRSGNLDIYVSKFVNGNYTTPENLGPLVNAAETDYDPFISQDEKLLIFTSTERKGGFGKADLYYSEKKEDGTWSQAKNLGNRINTEHRDFCPYISPDGKYFFYSSNGDVKWVDAKYLPHKLE